MREEERDRQRVKDRYIVKGGYKEDRDRHRDRKRERERERRLQGRER